MSQYNATGSKAFITATAGLTRFQRVKLNASGQIELAGSDEAAIGFVDGFVGASADVAVGDAVTVRLLTAAGTFKAIANSDAPIAAGASLYGAADGKVTDVDPGTGTIRFLALEAGSADGSVIEVLPLVLN